MESKPIFIIRHNRDIIQQMEQFGIVEDIMDKLHDYHVLFIETDVETALFECYNPNDLPDDVRESTLEMIQNAIQQSKPEYRSRGTAISKMINDGLKDEK